MSEPTTFTPVTCQRWLEATGHYIAGAVDGPSTVAWLKRALSDGALVPFWDGAAEASGSVAGLLVPADDFSFGVEFTRGRRLTIPRGFSHRRGPASELKEGDVLWCTKYNADDLSTGALVRSVVEDAILVTIGETRKTSVLLRVLPTDLFHYIRPHDQNNNDDLDEFDDLEDLDDEIKALLEETTPEQLEALLDADEQLAELDDDDEAHARAVMDIVARSEDTEPEIGAARRGRAAAELDKLRAANPELTDWTLDLIERVAAKDAPGRPVREFDLARASQRAREIVASWEGSSANYAEAEQRERAETADNEVDDDPRSPAYTPSRMCCPICNSTGRDSDGDSPGLQCVDRPPIAPYLHCFDCGWDTRHDKDELPRAPAAHQLHHERIDDFPLGSVVELRERDPLGGGEWGPWKSRGTYMVAEPGDEGVRLNGGRVLVTAGGKIYSGLHQCRQLVRVERHDPRPAASPRIWWSTRPEARARKWYCEWQSREPLEKWARTQLEWLDGGFASDPCTAVGEMRADLMEYVASLDAQTDSRMRALAERFEAWRQYDIKMDRWKAGYRDGPFPLCGAVHLDEDEADELFCWVDDRMEETLSHATTVHAIKWDQAEAVARALGWDMYECSCGPGWSGDEDGCCVSCGEDLAHDEDGNVKSAAWALCEAAVPIVDGRSWDKRVIARRVSGARSRSPVSGW